MTGSLTITRVRAYEYVMPLNRGFGTARGVVNQARNLLIVLEAIRGGSRVVGFGEAAPRSPHLSGDTKESSWSFWAESAEFLHGRTVGLARPEASLEEIRQLMGEIRDIATRSASRANGLKPLRGSQSGIDMAILDLVARAYGITVADLLGRRRDHADITAATISSVRDAATIERKTRAHAHRFPVNRVKCKGELETDLSTMRLVAETNRSAGVEKPLWVDVNEGLELDEAYELIERVTAEMRRDLLPRRVIVEQPVPKAHGIHLPKLQRLANRRLRRTVRRTGPWRLSVMADESLWDEAELDGLFADGGCAAINIKIQKAGGLLAARDLAEVVVARNPRTEIYLGGMLGTSDITCWAMSNLARAMPRLDYFTSVPPGNVEARIGAPRAAYASKGSNRLIDQMGPGIGVEVDLPHLVGYVTRGVRIPAAPERRGDRPRANRFGLEHLGRFKKLALDSHLIEQEALAHGMDTTRLSTLIFSARPPSGEGELAFYWTSSNRTSRIGTYVAGNKQIARRVLQKAGVSVPEGRQFHLSQRDHAVSYAHKLGWPVVVKPQAGTGGFGATTNINSDSDLAWAIEAIKQTRHSDFVVERHIAGDKYRFLVVGERVLSVVNTQPASVVGDGFSSVAELVLEKNLLRADNPHLRKRPIRLEDRSLFQLQRQELSWESVPDAGQVVALSTAENLNQGGDSIEVLDETHPSLLEMAVKAAAALPGLHHAGVDFLIEDRTRPVDQQSAAICEINSIPASTMHHFPMIGPPRDVSREILKAYCEWASIPLQPPASEICADIRIRGVVQRVGYRQWFQSLARDLGLSGWVRNTSEPDLVESRAAGPTHMVAALASMAVVGPPKARPELVSTRQVRGESVGGRFDMLSDGGV